MDGIGDIKRSLAHIDLKLDELGAAIANLDCDAAIRASDPLIDVLRARWKEYNEQTRLGPRYATEVALREVAAGKSVSLPPSEAFDSWAKKVLAEEGGGAEGRSVISVLDDLHDRLVRPELNGKASTINACGVAALKSFRLAASATSGTFSFDDRQYFNSINNLLQYYQIWQTR